MGVPKWGSQCLGEPERGLPEVEHPVGSMVKEDRHLSDAEKIKPQRHRKKAQWSEWA